MLGQVWARASPWRADRDAEATRPTEARASVSCSEFARACTRDTHAPLLGSKRGLGAGADDCVSSGAGRSTRGASAVRPFQASAGSTRGVRSRFLGGFLGEREVAAEAAQARDGSSPTRRRRPARGSTVPRPGASPPPRPSGRAESAPPGSIAASRSSASKVQVTGPGHRDGRRTARPWSASGRPARGRWSPPRRAAAGNRG
jgi:hypothetical protein